MAGLSDAIKGPEESAAWIKVAAFGSVSAMGSIDSAATEGRATCMS